MSADGGFRAFTLFDGDTVKVSCAGELDMATADVLRDATQALASDAVIDFTNVGFCDSTGVGVLIALQQRLRDKSYRLRVTGVQPVVVRVFEATGLVDALGVEAANRVSELVPRRHLAMRHPAEADD